VQSGQTGVVHRLITCPLTFTTAATATVNAASSGTFLPASDERLLLRLKQDCHLGYKQ